MKPLSVPEIQKLLESVLPNLESVDKAPSYSALEEEAERQGVLVESLAEAECAKEYKAADQWGTVYIVSAPAWTTYQMVQGKSPIKRCKRRYDANADFSTDRAKTPEEAKRLWQDRV